MSAPVDETTARARYYAMVFTRLAGAGGAVLGLILVGRAHTTAPKILGIALVLSALLMIAVVPRAMARKWRTPPKP